MTIRALELLTDAGLLTNSGKVFDLSKLTEQELASRLSHYVNGRIQIADSEVANCEKSTKLSALFSTESTEGSFDRILSSLLVYDSIILDDPLISSYSAISKETLHKGLKLFSWSYTLIKGGFIKILPLSHFNRPNDSIPLLSSDDAFRSSIPAEIHDYIHQNATLKSVIKGDNECMIVLPEDAHIQRRPALNVEFRNDYWRRGVRLYLFQTIENSRTNDKGELLVRPTWNPNEILPKEKFEAWSYQTINQAMRIRLNNIYNETSLATALGHTYITESEFEAKLMSMTGMPDPTEISRPTQFLEANNSFIYIDSPNTIVELRTKYGYAFERFNHSLQTVSAKLASVSPDSFDQQSKSLFHTEILPQIDELRSGLGSLSKAGIKGGLSTLTGLAAAIVSGSSVPLIPALMLGAAGAMTEALPLIASHQYSRKKPAYIWHRVLKK